MICDPIGIGVEKELRRRGILLVTFDLRASHPRLTRLASFHVQANHISSQHPPLLRRLSFLFQTSIRLEHHLSLSPLSRIILGPPNVHTTQSIKHTCRRVLRGSSRSSSHQQSLTKHEPQVSLFLLFRSTSNVAKHQQQSQHA